MVACLLLAEHFGDHRCEEVAAEEVVLVVGLVADGVDAVLGCTHVVFHEGCWGGDRHRLAAEEVRAVEWCECCDEDSHVVSDGRGFDEGEERGVELRWLSVIMR